MIDDGRILSLAKGVALQNLGANEGAVVLTIESGQLYTCNDTTAQFLVAIDGNRTFNQIVLELGNVYDVSQEELKADLNEIADQLIADGIIV
jgi:hypothetical protein